MTIKCMEKVMKLDGVSSMLSVQLTTWVSMTVEALFLLVSVTETGELASASLTVTLIGPAQVY